MHKLTEQEYFDLQTQYEKTPALSDSFGASGEHYILIALLRRMGFYEPDRGRALHLAENLLSNGYTGVKHDTHA